MFLEKGLTFACIRKLKVCNMGFAGCLPAKEGMLSPNLDSLPIYIKCSSVGGHECRLVSVGHFLTSV